MCIVFRKTYGLHRHKTADESTIFEIRDFSEGPQNSSWCDKNSVSGLEVTLLSIKTFRSGLPEMAFKKR